MSDWFLSVRPILGQYVASVLHDTIAGYCDGLGGEFSWRRAQGALVVAVLPGYGQIAAGDVNGLVRVLCAASGRCLQRLYGHAERIVALAVTPEGYLASGCAGGAVSAWDLRRGRCVRRLGADRGDTGRGAEIRAMVPCRRGLAVARGADVIVWRPGAGACDRLGQHGVGTYALAAHPSGSLFSGGGDGAIIEWDAAGRQVRTHAAHAGRVCELVAYKQHLVSAGWDELYCVWDLCGNMLAALQNRGMWGGAVTLYDVGPERSFDAWGAGCVSLADHAMACAPGAAQDIVSHRRVLGDHVYDHVAIPGMADTHLFSVSHLRDCVVDILRLPDGRVVQSYERGGVAICDLGQTDALLIAKHHSMVNALAWAPGGWLVSASSAQVCVHT
jgi:WD40 repeat protein